MNALTVLFLCAQAFLVQSTFGQYLGRLGGPAGCAPGAAVSTGGFGNPGLAAPYGAIGGYGTGLGLGYGAGVGLGYGGLGGAYGAAPYGVGCGLAEYGGAGEGNVGVAGELPVAGATAVVGQVPILGAVRFGGDVCAGGAVSIAGNCACGCGCGCGGAYGAPFGGSYLI